jgi:TonB family protein
VQQYFDNIDKRISKLEPHPEGEPPTGTIAPVVTRRSLEEPTTAAEMEELRLRRMGRTRLILEPIASPVEETQEAPVNDRPIRIPLEHYTPPSRFGAAPTLLVLVLIGAAFAIYHDPTILRHGFAVVVRLFRTDDAASATNSRTSQSTPVESRPSDQEASPNNEQRQLTATAQPPVESTPSSPPADTQNQAAESQTPSNHADSGSSHFADRAVAQTGQAIEAGISSVEAAGAINVNPSVMNRNLLVSRVPAYPEFAKMSRIEGDVVMQALISKQGTVKRVHVTEGDSRLRSAAEEAVYKWRYRPYVLNGQPVEVATTVTVNFALNR